ncbi:unnamed protein product [Clonostachys solani]|uniref:F-box domain-containing protein n=1 Tax=Clonostachys solani TaxID=160281 RepID=A0A9N9W8A3_9HYPO|nr:unnamed protein product [Clonostachys solani]
MDIAQDSDSNIGSAENSASYDGNIPSLPDDVLYEILSYFKPRDSDQHKDWKFEKERRQVVQNLRLVCGRFNQIASPHLMDELIVRIDEQSLAHATRLLETPLISPGIRSIKVVLAYRPKEIADHIFRFAMLKMEELREIQRDCSWKLDEYSSASARGEETPHQLVELYGEAIGNYDTIREAWKDHLEYGEEQGVHGHFYEDDGFLEDDIEEQALEEVRPEDEAKFAAYRQVLQEAHEQYAAKHREQYLLVKDASFARVLASSVARSKSSIAISFVDEHMQNMSRETDAPALTDKSQLSSFLLAPSSWGMIWEVDRDALIHTVGVLADLPMALMKEGIAVKQLKLFCFPVAGDFPRLKPSVGSWEDLEKALVHLELFRFEGPSTNRLLVGRWSLPEVEKRSNLFRYLGAAFMSSALESAHLDAHCLNAVPLHSVFQRIRWPRIKHLFIRNICLSQDDISDLCKGIAPAESLDLRWRSFKAVLDLLHEVAVRHQCRVKFKDPGIFDEKLQAATDMYLSADKDGRNPLDESLNSPLLWIGDFIEDDSEGTFEDEV